MGNITNQLTVILNAAPGTCLRNAGREGDCPSASGVALSISIRLILGDYLCKY